MLFRSRFEESDQGYFLLTSGRQYAEYIGRGIDRINDVPVEEVIGSFAPLFSADNIYSLRDQVKENISRVGLWEGNPYNRPDSTLKLTFTDGVDIVIEAMKPERRLRIESPEGDARNGVAAKERLPFEYEIRNDKKICVLSLRSLEDRQTDRKSVV